MLNVALVWEKQTEIVHSLTYDRCSEYNAYYIIVVSCSLIKIRISSITWNACRRLPWSQVTPKHVHSCTMISLIIKYYVYIYISHQSLKPAAPRHVLPGRLDRQCLGRLGQLRRLASTSFRGSAEKWDVLNLWQCRQCWWHDYDLEMAINIYIYIYMWICIYDVAKCMASVYRILPLLKAMLVG